MTPPPWMFEGERTLISDDLQVLRESRLEHPETKSLVVVSLEPAARKAEDDIWIEQILIRSS